VHSAGTFDEGDPASRHGVDLLGERGLDLTSHRSRLLRPELVAATDLLLGMARIHVREAVVLCPDVWPRAFTLKELVRRGEDIGSRAATQPLDEWLAKAHAGRTRSDLLGDDPDDDVFDPIGSSRSVYQRTLEELEDLIDRLVALLFGQESDRAAAP
jgi:protein-tyrosine phosphatase